jgi:uncharacterized protein YabN with tetrapyrrole methylase and pyrophosphatase domain
MEDEIDKVTEEKREKEEVRRKVHVGNGRSEFGN